MAATGDVVGALGPGQFGMAVPGRDAEDIAGAMGGGPAVARQGEGAARHQQLGIEGVAVLRHDSAGREAASKVVDATVS